MQRGKVAHEHARFAICMCVCVLYILPYAQSGFHVCDILSDEIFIGLSFSTILEILEFASSWCIISMINGR